MNTIITFGHPQTILRLSSTLGPKFSVQCTSGAGSALFSGGACFHAPLPVGGFVSL